MGHQGRLSTGYLPLRRSQSNQRARVDRRFKVDTPSRYPQQQRALVNVSLNKQTSVALGRQPYSLQELPVLMVALAVPLLVLVVLLKGKTVKIKL